MMLGYISGKRLRLFVEGKKIPIAQSKYEISALLDFLSDKSIGRVMEIGVSKGGTALLWANLVDSVDGKVYTLDKSFAGTRYSKFKLYHRMIRIEGDSHSQEIKDKVHEMVGSGSLEFLFIDGDHSYEGVKDDFNSYSHLVSDGGWIALHDIRDTSYHRDLGCFVSNFWNEIKDRYESFEILDPNDESRKGIGVIRYEC